MTKELYKREITLAVRLLALCIMAACMVQGIYKLGNADTSTLWLLGPFVFLMATGIYICEKIQ